MVCNGVLPIDQSTDYVSPSELVCQRIPSELLASHYGISPSFASEHQTSPDAEPTVGRRFLSAIAKARGFVTSNGLPDQSHSARLVLKDYVCGRLFYGHPPPGISVIDYQAFHIDPNALVLEAVALQDQILVDTLGATSTTDKPKRGKGRKNRGQDGSSSGLAHTTGIKGVHGFTRVQFTHSVEPVQHK